MDVVLGDRYITRTSNWPCRWTNQAESLVSTGMAPEAMATREQKCIVGVDADVTDVIGVEVDGAINPKADDQNDC